MQCFPSCYAIFFRFRYAFFAFSLLLFGAFQNLSAQRASVTGTVLNGVTKEPVPFANVYFNGTSIGTASDSLGRFEIKNIPTEYRDLVASSIGFKPLSASLKLLPNKIIVVEFLMTPDAAMLSSVVVRGKRDQNWSSRFANFKNYFIGNTRNSLQTKILNPEVLDFQYNSSTKTLTALADEPLLLDNLALGYQIVIVLEKFEASPQHYVIQTKSQFRELIPTSRLQAIQWVKNRVETFRGSQRHFVLSLIKGVSHEQGFTIRKGSADTHLVDDSAIDYHEQRLELSGVLSREDLKVDSVNQDIRLLSRGVYQVEYSNPQGDRLLADVENRSTSWIEVNNDYLFAHPSGAIKLPADFWQLGYLQQLRLADQLPTNYDFWTEEKKLIRNSNRGVGMVTGVVRDRAGRVLSDVSIFINQGSIQSVTNFWGQFQFDRLPAGRYPFVFTHPEMSPVLKVIEVDTADQSFDAVILDRKEQLDSSFRPSNRSIHERLLKAINPDFKSRDIELINPMDLYVKEFSGTAIVGAKNPLVFIDTKLGYQWTCYFKNALFLNNPLTGEIFVKMDTLKAENVQQKRYWLQKRSAVSRGSWNDFFSSLMDDRLSVRGFEVFEEVPNESKEKKWVSITSVDSMITMKGSAAWLTIDRKTQVRFYKRFDRKSKYRALNLEARKGEVLISAHGIYDPFELKVNRADVGRLPLVPIDYALAVQRSRSGLEDNQPKFREQIYLHTDKPYYYAGDTIWLKGYLQYTHQRVMQAVSRVLFVDLLNSDGIVVRTLTLPIAHGASVGEFALSDGITPGNYTLRAYTTYGQSFNEYYHKPVPIIPFTDAVESRSQDVNQMSANVNVTISYDRLEYHVNDTIGISVNILEEGAPSAGQFSVSVIDQSAVGFIPQSNIVDVLSHDTAKVIKPVSEIPKPDQGLVVRLKVLDGSNDDTYTVTGLLTQTKQVASSKFKGSIGSLVFDFADSATVVFTCKNVKGEDFNVQIINREPPITILPAPHTYPIKKATHKRFVDPSLLSDSLTVLDEVTVKAQRIVEKRRVTPTESRYGNAYTALNDKMLSQLKQSNDIFDQLLVMVPRIGNPRNEFQFLLNGKFIAPVDLEMVKPTDISRVEVYPRPQNMVAIYTQSMVPYQIRNPNLFRLQGFSKVNRFYGDSSVFNDYRTTIYWNPTVLVQSGIGKTRFSTSKSAGRYKLVIEGMTDRGNVFHVVDYIDVL